MPRLNIDTLPILDPLLISALVCVVLPSYAWLAPLLAVALLALSYIREWVPSRSAIFVPDPLKPEFKSLLEDLANRFASASQGGKPQPVYLATYCDKEGKTIPYSIDWDGKGKKLIVISQGAKTQLKIDLTPIFLIPLPFQIDRPKALYFSQIQQTTRCVVSEAHPCIRRALAFISPKRARVQRYKIYLIVLSTIWLLFDWESKPGLFGFTTLALSPIIISQLILFLPRLKKEILSFFKFSYLVIYHRILSPIYKLFK